MKQKVTHSSLRLAMANLCATYGFSLQTAHNTISILMNPNLPEMANENMDVCLAALLISQKLYESSVVPVQKLCCEGTESKAVLEMELFILKQLQFRVAPPLLID
jgi:hypothetical protein